MKVQSHVLNCMHLDPGYSLLSVQNIITCLEYFRVLDIHFNGTINDCLFWAFMSAVTDLTRTESDGLFNLLDVDHSGEMEFEEFYLIFCIAIACKDKYEKEFIYRHSNSIFKLIDADASGLVSRREFSSMGILFNFDEKSIKNIFKEFDISSGGEKNLDFAEFGLFAMACIDAQRVEDALLKIRGSSEYKERFYKVLRPFLVHFLRTNELPPPKELGDALAKLKPPSLFVSNLQLWFFLHPGWRFLEPLVTWIASIPTCISRTCTAIATGCRFIWKTIKKVKRTKTRASEIKRLQLTSYRYYNRNKRTGAIRTKKLMGGHVVSQGRNTVFRRKNSIHDINSFERTPKAMPSKISEKLVKMSAQPSKVSAKPSKISAKP